MVLEQDRAQAEQSSNIAAERAYRAQLEQYEREKKEYEKELEKYNSEEEKKKREQAAKAKAAADAQKKVADKEAEIQAKVNAYRQQWWAQNEGAKGSVGNRAIFEYEFKLRGGTNQQWADIVKAEDRNRTNALKQSAGLRAVGGAQVKASQQAELKRLEGGTKVSSTLGQTKAPVAAGTAAVAQPWESNFARSPPVAPIRTFQDIADPTATGFRPAERAARPVPPQTSVVSSYIAKPQTRTMYAVEQGGKTRLFREEKTAQKFIDRTAKKPEPFTTINTSVPFAKNEQKEKPFTDAKILPLESLYSWVNKGAEENRRISKERPNDFVAATMAAGSSFQAGLLNAATEGGKLIDKYILKQPTKETRQVITPVTYYDKGIEGTFEGALSGQAPYIHTEKISIRRGIDAAKKQWAKQTPAQNFGQTLAAAPIVAFDVVTLGQGGLALGRAAAKGVGGIAGKTVRPTLVNKVVNAPTGSKPNIVKKTLVVQPKKPYQVSGSELYSQVQSRQQSISGTTKLKPNTNVKADPTFKPPTRASEVQTSTGVIPKENIIGRINTSSDFIPNKTPDFAVKPKTPTPVKEDPFYKPSSRANEIDFTDKGDFSRSRYPPSRDTSQVKLQKDVWDVLKGRTRFERNTIRLGEGLGRVERSPRQRRFTQATVSFRGYGQAVDRRGTPITKGTPSFQNPRRPFFRKFDEPEIGKDDRLVGSGGTQLIVKTKQEASTILKKKQKTAVAAKTNTKESTAFVPITGSSPRLKPARTKLKPRVRTAAVVTSVTKTIQGRRSVSGTKTSAGTKARVFSSVKPKQSSRQSSRTRPIVSTKQPQKTVQAERQIFRSTSPQPSRPTFRSAFRSRQRSRADQKFAEPLINRKTALAATIPPIEAKRKRGKTKDEKTNEFLGNTRLGNIEGLFRRSEIIHGDRKIQKQIRKDRKAKFGEGKVRIF